MTSKKKSTPSIGSTFSHFELIELLSEEGAHGVVYKARDRRVEGGRLVALKLLSPTLGEGPDASTYIRKEAAAVAELDHPNIVPLYEYDEYEGVPYLCMQYIDGGSLKDRARKGPLPPEDILRIGIQLASTLDYAHTKGVIHCDVKTANVMMTEEGNAKLTDFGLAEIEKHGGCVPTGPIKGTIAYMSPEVVQGLPPSKRGDIYSLGVVLYKLATGALPFQASDAATMARSIVHDRERPIREIRSALPKDLEAIVTRMMAKAPEARYQDCREVVNALRSCEERTERTAVWAPAREDRRLTIRSLRSVIPIALLVAVVLILVWTRFKGHDEGNEALTGERSHAASIAVLFLKNMSSKEEDSWFADGLTQDIIEGLSHIGRIRVVPRMAVLPFKDATLPIDEMRRLFDCKYVLNGTVQRGAEQVRISVELVSLEAGHQVWNRRYDRELNLRNILSIQDDKPIGIHKRG